ncbi:hypothetical protein CC78DRAFT_537297 [Lojkania enalia]|uniref:Eisosome protein 1 n=1 Tax=Lojkania enalia TaxID=147567 RepID=A0A9P4K4A1_9PLEO|nr:hypothetical protein CC78DRAFT_537297 [Didymosphaeria enalia]
MAAQVQTSPRDANAKSLDTDLTVNGSLTPANMTCPDPSAHQIKSTTLQDQASAAALYSTNPSKGTNTRQANPLGTDGRLSSASAATSVKLARAQELPSFPVIGIDAQFSAGTAATLAHANQKSPQWPKPEASSAAGKAALLAHDYKMPPLWQPEASAAGSKAALLAHKDGVKMDLWAPEATSAGNSAATMAMRNKSLSPQLDYGNTEDVRKRALVAATGALSSSRRQRAHSSPASPPGYPDSENSARNALNAATIAHTPSIRAGKSPATPTLASDRFGSGAIEAARIQHSKSISREMYTEHPPIKLEVEEKQRQDALRASAISMAKQIYDVQQQHIDQTTGRPSRSRSQAQVGATTAHGQQQQLSDQDDLKQQAMHLIHVQEAAQKLAAERLAKIGIDENAAFRSYYGYDKPSRSKLSIRRGRQRASSNPEKADSDDELQSRRIRKQMSQLNKSLADIDAQRDQDRRDLLAAAERKVHAQMQGLDKKIFDETGKMSTAMIEEWDAKARAKAAAASEARMENHGKVHIGHGKFMDQADIDAIAHGRIQPTLDEIAEQTEKRRAEEEERRLEMEEQKRQAQLEKERTAELKAEEKRVKDEEKKAQKARTAEEKATARQEREQEKERRAEEKRQQKEDKRKSREAAKPTTAPATTPATAPAQTDGTSDEVEAQNDDLYQSPTSPAQEAESAIIEASDQDPTSPASPASPKADSKGFKSFLNRFKRRSKRSSSSAETEQPSFLGGASLRAVSAHSRQEVASAHSEQESPQDDQTHAITSSHSGPSNSERNNRYSDISSISNEPASDDRGRSTERITANTGAVSGGTEFEEARDGFDERLAPPPSYPSSTDVDAGRRGSPSRDSRFREVGL